MDAAHPVNRYGCSNGFLDGFSGGFMQKWCFWYGVSGVSPFSENGSIASNYVVKH